MYTFLCQKINGEITYDFVLEAKNAVEFANWYNDEKVYALQYVDDIDTKVNVDYNTIPVGTVEFVEGFYLKHFGIPLKPINMPMELRKYAMRKVWDGSHLDVRDGVLFCKSNEKTKGYTNIIAKDYVLPEGEYQFSELININSEWRCFVYKGKLLAVHNYINSVDQRYFPEIEIVKKMIQGYEKLDAYTLDIGVNDDGTFPIEVHDFYSCGLYGFSDHNALLKMLISSHVQKLGKGFTVYHGDCE